MTFEEWYSEYSKHWGNHTKQDVSQSIDVIQAAYSAGVQDERERLSLLAEAVLEAHSFDCKWCPFTNSEPDCTAAGCNDGQGCQCHACKVAREVLSE